jgi:hypothetical protein
MAVVESIYSSLILDTRQYEEALRKIVGISKDAEKTFDDGFKKGKASVEETTKSVDKLGGALKALGASAGFAAVVAGFKGMIDSAVQAESQIKGLAAVIKNKLGEEAVPQAAKMVKTLSTELGLTTGAVTQATKNLVSMGFSLADTEKLLRGATDMAVDNRQAHYDLSESVQVWTEGLKNNNSTLSDSIGISENISKQYSRLGVDGDKLSDALGGVADRTKLVNDFTSQFAVNAGRAKENLQGYSGATQSLNKSTSELSISIGQVLREAVTPFVTALASGLKWLVDWVKGLDTLGKSIIVFAATFATVGTAVVALKGLLAVAAPEMAASLAIATGGISLMVTALALAIGAVYALSDAERTRNQGLADRSRFQAQAGMAANPTGFAAGEARLRRLGSQTSFTREAFSQFQSEMNEGGVPTEGLFRTRNERGANGTEARIVVDQAALQTRLRMFDEIRKDQANRPVIIPVQLGGDKSKDRGATGGGVGFNYGIMEMLKETAAGFADSLSKIGSHMSNFGSVIVQNFQAAAQLASVKLNNLKQNVDFMASALNAIGQSEADKRQKDFDEQIAQIDAQNQALLDQERQYQLEKARLKAEFDESAKAENERLYQEALEMMRADMESKRAENDINSADAEQRMINDEQLQDDFNKSRIKLRSDFDQKLLDQTKNFTDKQIEQDKAQGLKKEQAEKDLAAKREAAESAKKIADEKAKEEEKQRSKAFELFKWAAGRSAFELDKKAKVAQAVLATAMMVLDITRAAFGPGFPLTLPFLGFIPLALHTGQMTVQAAQSAQYPPPPVFANGGIATQPSIFGEAGAELAIPFNNPGRDFGALKKEVADNLTNGTGGNVTNVYMEGIQINGSNMEPNELADFVADKIRRDVYMAAAG